MICARFAVLSWFTAVLYWQYTGKYNASYCCFIYFLETYSSLSAKIIRLTPHTIETRSPIIVIFAHLIQAASSLPTDASALESSISALERDIKALENSSVPWENWLPWFTVLVAIGVAMEFWVIWRERRDGMEAWKRGTILPPERPSTAEFIIELASLVLITGGIVGELGIGIKITSINGTLRTKNGELRTKSDQLIGLLGNDAAQLKSEEGALNVKAATLTKEAEDERLARVKIEAAVGWRSLSDQQKRDMGAALASFSLKAGASIWFNGSSTEAEMFAKDIAEALRLGHITTTAPGGFMEMPESGKWGEPIKPAETGVRIQCTKYPSACEFADAFIKELTSRGFDAHRQTDPPFDDKVKAPVIWVNVEPRPKGPQGEYKLQAEREAKAKNKASNIQK